MTQTFRRFVLFAIFATASALNAQESLCDLFSHLESADGSQVVVTGDLIIAKHIAVLVLLTVITVTPQETVFVACGRQHSRYAHHRL